MSFEEVVKKYETELRNVRFEILHTPRLGWIAIRTDYQRYSNPIKQFLTPEEMEEYILSQVEAERLEQII